MARPLSFALDKVVAEPLAWPGAKGKEIDKSGFGSYKFEVRDTTGKPLFSRGYSPIYAEWVTTAESSDISQTFHESLRSPEPSTIVDILVFKRDGVNRFVEA